MDPRSESIGAVSAALGEIVGPPRQRVQVTEDEAMAMFVPRAGIAEPVRRALIQNRQNHERKSGADQDAMDTDTLSSSIKAAQRANYNQKYSDAARIADQFFVKSAFHKHVLESSQTMEGDAYEASLLIFQKLGLLDVLDRVCQDQVMIK